MSDDAHGASPGTPAGSEAGGQEFTRPATPLTGYADVGAPVAGHSGAANRRAWTIVGLMLLLYFLVTVSIYLWEPGLR